MAEETTSSGPSLRRLLRRLGIGRASVHCAEPGCDEVAGEPLEKGDPSYCAAHLLRSPSLQRRLTSGPGSQFRQDLDRRLRELGRQDATQYTEADAPEDRSAGEDGWNMQDLLRDLRPEKDAESGKEG